jgi:hypothetical protein
MGLVGGEATVGYGVPDVGCDMLSRLRWQPRKLGKREPRCGLPPSEIASVPRHWELREIWTIVTKSPALGRTGGGARRSARCGRQGKEARAFKTQQPDRSSAQVSPTVERHVSFTLDVRTEPLADGAAYSPRAAEGRCPDQVEADRTEHPALAFPAGQEARQPGDVLRDEGLRQPLSRIAAELLDRMADKWTSAAGASAQTPSRRNCIPFANR